MFQHTIYFWDLTVHVSCCIKLSRQFFKEIQKSIGILSKWPLLWHHRKKKHSHNDINASYTIVKPLTALLNCLPVSIWSTVHPAYTSESTNMSRKPPSDHNLPIADIKHERAWNPPNLIIWFSKVLGIAHFTCWTAYSCWSNVWRAFTWPTEADMSRHFFIVV